MKTPVWDRHSIKAEIYRRKQTLIGLAALYNLPPSSLRVALGRPYPKADRVISRFLNVPLHELWPDRYTRLGDRIKSAPGPKPSKRKRAGQRLNEVAG